MRRRRFLELGAGAALVALAPTEAPAGPSRRGGVLKHIGVDPASFDVQGTTSQDTQLASSLVRRTLFKLATGARHGPTDLTLAPDLALKAEVSGDGRTYAISLRRAVRWEDRPPLHGRELIAADVQYTIERAIKRSPYAYLLGPIQGVEVSGPYTLRLHLTEPHAPLLHYLAEPWLAVLAPEVEDRFGDFRVPEALIGCGPFVLSRYEPGVKALFVRNPNYYRSGLPYLDRVDWLFIRERATQLSLFRAGQVDLPSHDSRIPAAEAGAFRQHSPGYPVAQWDSLVVRSLALRSNRPPLGDARVRRALSLAIDRKQWVSEYPDGQSVEDPGPVPAAMREWKLAAREHHDPALAIQLLTEAGFPNGLRLKCSYGPGQAAEAVEDIGKLAASFRRIGVELTSIGEESGSYVRGAFVGRIEETSWGASALFADVDGYLYGSFKTGQPANRAQVADARLDAMLEAQRRATSRAARKKGLDDIQRHVAERVHYLYTPIARNVSSWAPWVRNYSPRNSLDRGAQLETVYLAGR